MPDVMRENHGAVYLWPSGEQLLLLRAGLLDGQAAVDAFNAWRSRVRLEDDFSYATSRLLPLAYHNLHALGVDDPLMPRLKGVYRHSWYMTQRLMHAVQPAVDALDRAGVPVLMTKGMPLALTYYRNPALRPMSDADIVVPRVHLERTLDVLSVLGWHGSRPDDEAIRHRHAVQLFNADGREIDVHWRALFESDVATEQDSFFSTAEPLTLQATTVRQPDPSHALFHTIVHGLRWNPETPVRWIPDSLMILRTRGGDIDWDVVHELAVGHRVLRRTMLGLKYLATEFDAPIPPHVLERLNRAPQTLFERFESRVALMDDGSVTPAAWRTQVSWLAEYARHNRVRNPFRFVVDYSHYMRYRMRLDGRREILARIARSFTRRVSGGARNGADA
jgi:hypothetical protein